MDKPSYYAIIPANVRYDKNLKANEKLLYGEITALSQQSGRCFASNDYFAKLFDVTNIAISRWVSNLVKYGYINRVLEYRDGTKQIVNRYLSLSIDPINNSVNDLLTKKIPPINQKVKDNTKNYNNTSINNININNININKYGEYQRILLTDKQYKDLENEWGETELLRMITIMDESIEMNPKKYKYTNFKVALKKWKRNQFNSPTKTNKSKWDGAINFPGFGEGE